MAAQTKAIAIAILILIIFIVQVSNAFITSKLSMPSCEQSCEFALICKGHLLLASLKVLSQRARVATLLN